MAADPARDGGAVRRGHGAQARRPVPAPGADNGRAARQSLIGLDAETRFEAFLGDADIEEAPIDSAIGAAATTCFERYGKGRHPARLNFADCLSYACAKAHGAPLLFKGDDFAQTDVKAR
ncbi:MAG TPA: type II toxin-antitoxin system VapC family toxin [Roseiarcus sp.]